MFALLEIFLKYILDGSSKVEASITDKRICICLEVIAKNYFSCEENQILRRILFPMEIMEIATNFKVVKLG